MVLFRHIPFFGCRRFVLMSDCRQRALSFIRPTNILCFSHFHSEFVFPKSPLEAEITGCSQHQRHYSVVQQKSKRNRRKRPLTMLIKDKQNVDTTASPLAEVNCVPIAEGFDIEVMCRDLDFTSFFTFNYIDDNKIAIHCQHKLSNERKMKYYDDFFVFAEGVVVFWDVDRNSQSSIVNILSKFQQSPFTGLLKNDEEETMAVDFTPGFSYASNDVVFLNSDMHRNAEHSSGSNPTLERFAFSHAMAASELDDQVQLCIDGMKDSSGRWWVPLRRNGIPWTHKKALQMIGSFADLRHTVNSTDLLSKDIYWDLPQVESVYGSLAKRLCLQSRRHWINERLGHCEYFSKTISEALNIEHSHFLEVVIILLIAFECAHVATNWFGFGHRNDVQQQQRSTAAQTEI